MNAARVTRCRNSSVRHTARSAAERASTARIFTISPERRQRAERATTSISSTLSPAEVERQREAALANGDGLSMLHAEALAHALLSREEEVALIRRAQAGDTVDARQAREAFVSANIRLVSKVAAHYARPGARVGAEREDLIQEGMLGLLHAVELFDPDKGYRFSTYATLWIRQRIARALVDRGGIIRTPAFMAQRQGKLKRLRAQLEAQTGETPTTEQLAEESGLPLEQVEEALLMAESALGGEVASLDRWVSAVRGNSPYSSAPARQTLGDLIPDPTAEDAFEEIERRVDLVNLPSPDSVTAIMQRFTARGRDAHTGRDWAREMEIVRRRVLQGATLDAIAQDLGVGRERVRQLGNAGLKAIRMERARVRREMREQERAQQTERGTRP